MKFFATTISVITILLTVLLTDAFCGVSISIGDPGFYGRIDIGNFQQPRLIYSEPVIARRVTTWYPPIYLRVPPGHRQQWYRHCGAYNACGRPVYFVDDAWYQDVYAPRYRERHQIVVPPPPPRKPVYYEYRRDGNKPAKRIYPQEYRQDNRRGDGYQGRR
ncbi:MAG: hypothetical protein FWF31_05840 [Desulfobulbus sp.]|nr:hypothetical protein [Desulfobulbus sp.]